jgi:hypothetical protein
MEVSSFDARRCVLLLRFAERGFVAEYGEYDAVVLQPGDLVWRKFGNNVNHYIERLDLLP